MMRDHAGCDTLPMFTGGAAAPVDLVTGTGSLFGSAIEYLPGEVAR